jgi:outer membrane receptor for ferrienterochelin and colicins
MIRTIQGGDWCLPLLALGAINVVSAQEAAPPGAGNRQEAARPAVVEIRSAAYDPRRDDTGAKIVVTQEEIIKYGDTMVSDVLRRQPGITVNGAPGRGGEIRMRGLGSGYTLILLNGERTPAGFSIDSLAPGVIERIEILRAASAELSNEAIAGTINIILKRSASKLHREFKPAIGGGDGYLMPGFNLLLSDRTEKLSYSVAVNGIYNKIRRSDPAFEYGTDASGTPFLERRTSNRYDSIFRGLFLVPRVTWILNPADTLSLQALINLTRFSQDSRLRTTTSLGPAPLYPDSDDAIVDRGDMARPELNWIHSFDGGAKLDTKVSVTVSNNDSALDQEGFASGSAPALNRRVDIGARERGVAWTGKYLSPASKGHVMSTGWDVNMNRRTEDRSQRDTTVLSDDFATEDSMAKVSRLALYVQDEWTVSPQYALYMGARWEGIRIQSEAYASDEVTNTSRIWSPVLQMLYKVPDTKSNQLRVALTRTYKAPAVSNLTPRRLVSLNNSPTEPDRIGNPELRPELALGIDASYQHYWDEKSMLSISVSTRKIENYTRTALFLDDGRWVGTPVNDGDARTHSVELETKFPLRSFWNAGPALDLRASVSRNWSRVETVPGPDNRIDQQTPLSAVIGVDYRAGVLGVGTTYTFKNGGFVRIADNLGAYQTVRRDLDAYLTWRLGPKDQLRFSVSNILQQDQIAERTYLSAAQLRSRMVVTPGTMLGRVTWEKTF